MPVTAAEDERDLACLRDELGRGGLDDPAFDALYPEAIRARSSQFWTPVAVASRAAQLLAAHGARRVLDIGSGAGKFCLTAAIVRPELDLLGIEHRPHLVEAARDLSARLGLGNVRFREGDATSLPWTGFDGLYFFNPFAENVFDEDDHLDETVELSHRRFLADVGRAVLTLKTAPAGTCVVTYHGLGSPIPGGYRLVRAERAHTDWLQVWVRR